MKNFHYPPPPILQCMYNFLPQIILYISLGEYWPSYNIFYFPLLRFSALVITKYQGNGSRSINMKNCHSFFHPFCRVCIYFPHRAFYFPLVEYWSNYTINHFSLLGFSVLVITKQQKTGSRSRNRNNNHNIFSHLVDYGPCVTI